MLSTDSAWRKWGRDDPYYGVLSHDRFRAGSIEQYRDEFFASGRAFIDKALERHERHFGPLPRERALDHGCGVGRLTLPLARHFGAVVALDVSEAMLAEAQANAARASATNIRFALADDRLSEASGRFNLVVSLMVLQHVPVRRGLAILDALLDRVAPGGGFHIHVSARTDRGGPRWLYWASANIPGVKIWQNICAGRAWNAPAMQMNHYPVETIVDRMAERGALDLLVTAEPHARFVTISLSGRMPAA